MNGNKDKKMKGTIKVEIICCPICGSEKTQCLISQQEIQIPYGPNATYESIDYECLNCEEIGDFTGENDQRIEEAISKSNYASMIIMLDELSKKGITESYFERALRLPSRTISQWKINGPSASELALLRFVKTYNWLLKVSDSNFNAIELI